MKSFFSLSAIVLLISTALTATSCHRKLKLRTFGDALVDSMMVYPSSDTTRSDSTTFIYDTLMVGSWKNEEAAETQTVRETHYEQEDKYDPLLYHTDYNKDQEDERRRFIDNDGYDENDGYDVYYGYGKRW